MTKERINQVLREHAKNKISPDERDRNLVSTIYEAFRPVLGQSCIQIGSYPRFTAIRPLHDLDILYDLGKWQKGSDPRQLLKQLKSKIELEYENPTQYSLKVDVQTHSVTVSFQSSGEEFFSVDIVPAYRQGTNEFGLDTYVVPEVLSKQHGEKRNEFYQYLAEHSRDMGWIPSDPRGYIEIAKQLNSNPDFRKTAKLVKAWKNGCVELFPNLKLKSFHFEQVITGYYREQPTTSLFDALFRFFFEIPRIIEKPQIHDRAVPDKYIDDYLDGMSRWDKETVVKLRDGFLAKLESFDVSDSVEELFRPELLERPASEEYLFDKGIPTLTTTEHAFKIRGFVLPRKGSFRPMILDSLGIIEIDREIQFRIDGTPPSVNLFKWKVKNDDESRQPRGEITDNQTLNDPEHTAFRGEHYVECYAILDQVCVAKARQKVQLK